MPPRRRAPPAPYLSADVVSAVLAHLADPADVAAAASVDRTWAAAARTDAAWAGVAAAMGWLAGGGAAAAYGRAADRAPPTAPPPPQLPPGHRARCAALLPTGCHDCGVPTRRRTVATAPLVLRLCHRCAAGYDHARAGQRLMPRASALFEWRLRPADLDGVPHAVDVNPIEPAFAPMRLYRRRDARAAAVARWGSPAAADGRRRPLVPYGGGDKEGT